MPVAKSEDECESSLAACLAAAALVNGIVLVFVSMAALQSGALAVIDRLVSFDEAWQSGLETPPLVITTRRVFKILVFAGLLVVFASLLGIIGAKSRRRCLVCTYVVLAGVFTLVVFAGAVHTIQRRSMVEPMVSRQVAEICNSTTYIQLASRIRCEFAGAYAASEVPECGAYCDWRASLMKRLHGCQVMPRLCQQFFYKELPKESCAAEMAQGVDTAYMTVESSERCRELCSRDIRCTAFAYSGASAAKPRRCLLGQAVASTHLPPRWSPVQPSEAAEYLEGGSSLSCYRRAQPVVLERFKSHGLRLAVCTMGLGFTLLASTSISCCLMYNVNIKRQGKPTARELALMMCCACCAGKTQQRFSGQGLSDDNSEEEDEEDEEEEGDSEAGRR